MIRTYGRRDGMEKDKHGWRIRLKTDHEEPWIFSEYIHQNTSKQGRLNPAITFKKIFTKRHC